MGHSSAPPWGTIRTRPPPQVQSPTPPHGALEQPIFRKAGPVSRHSQNPCTPAHGSPKAKSNASLASPRRQARGVCLPRCTLKAPAVTVCIPSAPVTPQLALRAGQNPAYPHSPSPWMERGPGGEVFFWLLFFSVSTGGPGTPVPGSQRQRQKNFAPFASSWRKNPSNLSHYAPTHTNFQANFFQKFSQLLSEQRHLCVNNPREVERERRQTPMV